MANVVGPLARSADRLGMWWMLRSDYGTDYALAPTQITQVSWEPYLELSLARDFERLFPAGRAPADVSLREMPSLLDDPTNRPLWLLRNVEETGGDVKLLRRDFAFPSPHEPLTPDFAAQFASTPENAFVHGRIYTAAATRPRNAIVVIHGFGTSSLDSVARFTPAERMASREIAVVALSLPYHGLRRPAASRFSGELFVSGDVVRTFEAILQAVTDLRTTIAWLRDALGIERIGFIGGSMGGYLATLTAAVEPGLDLLYAIAPPIRVTDNIDSVPLGRYMSEGLSSQAVPQAVLHQLQDLVDPSCHAPALATDRMRFIAGRNDLFVPQIHMQRLIDRWPGIHVDWHAWGHLTALLAWPPNRLYEEIERFAESHGF
jgi:dienelactone hydrolase